MAQNSHLESFSRCFQTASEDSLRVVRNEVTVLIDVHFPSQTAFIKVSVGVKRPRKFELEALSADKLRLTWGSNTVLGERLLVLAERIEDSSVPLHDDTRALVRLFRQVDGDPSYKDSFTLA